MKDLIKLFNEQRDLYHPKFKDDQRYNELGIMIGFVRRIGKLYNLSYNRAVKKAENFIKKLFQYEDEFVELKYGILSISVLENTNLLQKLITISNAPYKRKHRKKKTLKKIKQLASVAMIEKMLDAE